MVAAKKIYYLGFYNDCSVTKQERVIWLSAISKMNYIIDALVRSGFEIEVVSLSPSASTKNAYCGGVYDLKPGVKLRLFPTHSRNNRLLRALNILQIEGAVRKFLCGLEDDDVVLCYHNVQACKLLRKAKTKAGFKLLMEVEELYSDVSGDDDIRDAEIDTFGYADAFVFPTVLLNEVANPQKKPYALCSGVYEANKRIASKSDDGKIHIVYAGTLEPRKGAAAAVAAGALLDERF